MSMPMYLRIADHYRAKIRNGELLGGAMLPTTDALAEEWGTSRTTVTQALRLLKVERLTESSSQGVRVIAQQTAALSAQDRARTMTSTGRIYPPGQVGRVLSAAMVEAPEYVADALGVIVGVDVVRRERITLDGDDPVTWSVSWWPGDLGRVVPGLLSMDRLLTGIRGPLLEAMGRTLCRGRDQVRAVLADQTAADRLGVAAGAPVVQGRNYWLGDDGRCWEFGEFWLPGDRWVTYEYDF